MEKSISTAAIKSQEIEEEKFQSGHAISIATGHFVHDLYGSFLAPLLPFIVEKLSLSFTLAGVLSMFQQLPALLNPFVGYLADRLSLRYLVIFAPAVTATAMSALGAAPSYLSMGLLLLAAGVSSAAFHAPAPAMVARISHNRVGLGMSIFMAAGELGRSVGPLLAVWAVTAFTLEGTFQIAVMGWAATALLYWRLKDIPANTQRSGTIKTILPMMKRVLIPLVAFVFFRNFITVSLQTYLPLFMNERGGSAFAAGGALALVELAGVAGALAGGTLSDRLGRARVLGISTIGSSVFMLLFLAAEGWTIIPALIFLGFTAFASNSVILSLVQDNFKENRALANGMWIALAFAVRPVHATLIGLGGDTIGLQASFFWGALIGGLGLLPVYWLSKLHNPRPEGKG